MFTKLYILQLLYYSYIFNIKNIVLGLSIGYTIEEVKNIKSKYSKLRIFSNLASKLEFN